MTELSVCIGSACHLRGAYNVIQTFRQMIEEYNLADKVELKGSFCMKACECDGVSVSVNGKQFKVFPEKASEFFKNNVM